MAYDGLYGDLSTRGTTNEILTEVLEVQTQVLQSESNVATLTSQTIDNAALSAGSAITASNSAIQANTAATNAIAAQNAAATSQAAVVANTGRFLSPKASDPSVRDNGSSLQTGDRYLNTTNNIEYIYEGGIWSPNNLDGQNIANASDPTKGSALVGFDSENLSVQLNLDKKLYDYAQLRAYNGTATRVNIIKNGISGSFIKRAKVGGEVEITGIVFLHADGVNAWQRDFQGDVQASWFEVVAGDTVGRYSAETQKAINYASSTRARLRFSGTIYLSTGFLIPSTSNYHFDFTGSNFILDASAPYGCIIGTAGSNPYRGTIAGLNLSKASPGTGDIGIWMLNAVEADLKSPVVNNFEKSNAVVPSGSSRVAYCKIDNPTFSNHAYAVWINPADGTSYANENTWTAGRFSSFIAARLFDQVYISNASGQGAQHNRFIGVSMEGYSSSGFCGKSAARMVSGAIQNVFEWCRTERYNSGWEDGTYVFDATTNGNLVFDTRSDVTFVDAGANNWWTPITGFHFSGFQTLGAAQPAFKYTRSAPLTDVNTKYALDINDTYSTSGEVGLLKYTSARGGGTLIDITTTLGSLRMNGSCEWTTPSKRSGAVTGSSSHGYSVAASVTGATLCAAYHSLKDAATGNWFLYGEGSAPSYFGGLIRTLGTNTITPATNATGALFFSNTSTNTGAVATEYQTNNTATRYHVSFANPNGVVGSISTNGTSTTYNTASDAKLKKNIQDASDSGDHIDQIRVAQFDWKVNNEHQDYGFIAQELVEVAPYAVAYDPENPDADWSVDYSKLVPLMMKEIQMLRARVLSLETK